MAEFAGANIYSKLVASKGFWQMKLTEERIKLTTFNTLFGKYRHKTLSFGISAAPEIYHKKMLELFGDISKCRHLNG